MSKLISRDNNKPFQKVVYWTFGTLKKVGKDENKWP